jgi:hypothetical protein
VAVGRMGKADRSTCKIFEMRVGESANLNEGPIICGRLSESKYRVVYR